MNFGHVCVSALMAVIICGVCFGCIAVVEYCDNFAIGQERGMLYVKICAIGTAMASLFRFGLWQSVAMGIVLGALLFACITDCAQCQVYRFTWWIAGSVSIVWLIVVISRKEQIHWWELILFCMLQELGFAKLYGKADCHAFCTCATVYTALGRGIWWYVLHMTLSFLLLSYIQWRNGNIAHDGNLKKPVPYMPYIVLLFVLLCIGMANKYSY